MQFKSSKAQHISEGATHTAWRGEGSKLQTPPTDWSLFAWTIHEIITKSNKKQSVFANDSWAG